MVLKRWFVIFVLLAVALGCSNSEKEAGMGQKPVTDTQKVNLPKKATMAPAPLMTTQYSDGKEWKNGVNIKKGNMFYFTLLENSRNPIAVGSRLRFAASGEMFVTEMTSMESQDKTSSSIFVTMDRPLEPIGDGYPNPIQILSVAVIAASYSQKGEYLNGIHLTKTGLFFLTKKSTDFFPVKVGGRMKFLRAGEATITRVALMSSNTPGYTTYFITVDKPLDPKEDGFPKPIELLFNN